MFDDLFNDYLNKNVGCLLCIHGIFKPGIYPQRVDCRILGNVEERKNCEEFETEMIKEKQI